MISSHNMHSNAHSNIQSMKKSIPGSSILDKDKFILSSDEPNFALNHFNYFTKIKKYENAKFGMKPNGVITSYGANTHQGLYRYNLHIDY